MNRLSAFFKDKVFFKTILVLALPIALQNFLNALVNVIDSLMVSEFGEIAMGAVHLVNQYVYIFQIVIIGIAGATGIFISQFFGYKQNGKIPPAFCFSMIITLGLGIVFTAVPIFFPDAIFSVFGATSEFREAGKEFVFYVSFSLIPFTISTVIGSSVRAYNKVKLPLIASIAAIGANIFFNYTFMFGKFGMPALGLAGAAIGTIIARCIELAIIVIGVSVRKTYIFARPKQFFSFDKSYLKQFFKVMLPALLNELMWVLGSSAYLAVYARMNDSGNILAAVNIVQSIEKIVFVFFIGIGNATSIVVGQLLGQDKAQEAYEFSKKSCYFVLLMGLLFLACMPFVAMLVPVLFRKINGTSVAYARHLLVIFGFFTTFRTLTFNLICGIMRTGGDANYCMIVEGSTIWLIAVPLALLTGLVFAWPVEIVYACINLEEVLKLFIMIRRFKSRKWIKNLAQLSTAPVAKPSEF